MCPQWLSEKMEAPPTTSREHRPWPYEFPGARTAIRPLSARSITSEIPEDEEEPMSVAIMTASGMPLWGSLNSIPRAWKNPAKYSYQLDSSRFDTSGAKTQPSR